MCKQPNHVWDTHAKGTRISDLALRQPPTGKGFRGESAAPHRMDRLLSSVVQREHSTEKKISGPKDIDIVTMAGFGCLGLNPRDQWTTPDATPIAQHDTIPAGRPVDRDAPGESP